MGFATGFTGGVTLTLSLAYVSLLAHQRNRETQSASLRAQALEIRSLLNPQPPPLPPTRSQVAAAQREATIEVAKDRWNSEVENAVKWAQRTDWDDVRQGMEERIGFLWSQLFGESGDDGAEKAKGALEPAVRRARANADRTGSEIVSAARGAFDQAKETAQRAELSAENQALDARLRVKKSVQEVTSEAQGAIGAALAKGKDKARQVVGQAKAAVGLAGAQVEEMAGGKVVSPVEKALLQRYGKGSGEESGRTAAEVLQERYTPMDQRDNTVLRGL